MDSDKACRIMQDAFDSKYPIKIEIARMLPEQIPQTAAIEAEVFTQPWSEQAFADALDLEQALFYTASVNGAVAGYCGIYLAADERYTDATQDIYIEFRNPLEGIINR